MHDKASEFTVQNEFTMPLHPWQRQMLQLATPGQHFRMKPYEPPKVNGSEAINGYLKSLHEKALRLEDAEEILYDLASGYFIEILNQHSQEHRQRFGDRIRQYWESHHEHMTPRPRKYFAVITLPSGARVELPRQETPESALNRAKDHGYSEDQIKIKMETPIPGRSETVPTETLRERFEKWAAAEWTHELLRRTTSYPGTNAKTIYRENEIQLAWEAFQEGAKAVS